MIASSGLHSLWVIFVRRIDARRSSGAGLFERFFTSCAVRPDWLRSSQKRNGLAGGSPCKGSALSRERFLVLQGRAAWNCEWWPGWRARGQVGLNAGPRFAEITAGSEFCNQQIVTGAEELGNPRASCLRRRGLVAAGAIGRLHYCGFRFFVPLETRSLRRRM
jgi:hypothetical protein